jgi:competence protein ComEA
MQSPTHITPSPFRARAAIVARAFALSMLLATGAYAANKAPVRGTAAVHGADKVNLNTADAATIDRVLLNIGPSKAQAIVAYRKEHGSFKSPEQLALVKGIGLKTVEKNRDRIVVAGGAPAAPRKPVATARPAAKR